MKKFVSLALVAVSSFVGAAAFSQDAAQPAAAPAANAAAQLESRTDGPEYAKFSAEMTKYKNNLKALRSLKDRYQTATPEERDAILAEFNPLIEATTALQKTLVPLALDAYRAVGGQNEELRAFLCGMLQWSVVERENYELAYSIAKGVFEFPLPENGDALYGYAALAALCVNEFEDAKVWRDVAKEKKVLSQIDPQGEMNLEHFLNNVLPEYESVWAKESEVRAQEAAANDLPRVLIKTNKGDITIELFKNEAPNAVGNFLTLVADGFYTDVPFHRVLPFFMAQGGDPTGTGAGGPGYCIPCECYSKNARPHFRGSLSMAHAGRNTGGSQFFLTFVPTNFLNGKHTVFGRVVEGMDVLSEIQRIDPQGETNVAPDKIIEAKIIRGEPFEFEKLPER